MGGYSGTSDLDLGKKVGLRKKSWKFGFLEWGGILELWIWTLEKKLEIWIFGMGGYSGGILELQIWT